MLGRDTLGRPEPQGREAATRHRPRRWILARRHLDVSLMMTLTFVTGVVDAVGFLSFDRVFTGNMTGNLVILGMGLGGAADLPVLGPTLAVCTFALGAMLAGMSLRRQPIGWSGRAIGMLAGCSAALLLVTLTSLVLSTQDHAMQLLGAAVTAAVMGGQAAVARKIAVTDMTTVVVTSTLTSLASEDLFRANRTALLNRRGAAIVTIVAGALTGAILLRQERALPLALASLLTAVVAFTARWANRPNQST
ncbi:YoaK family protein [Actinomadura sp. 3N508]|uniref:YoaK family protein n=1 Tax=Actinomadura sp. 3N508 TaxID=3375153 RepID=UPI0037AC251B